MPKYIKIEDILSIMSSLQPNCCLKIDFQKVDQHAGDKWLFFFFFIYISFIWHIQTRGTFSYIQHISTYIQTVSYTYISINIYTYDSQPVTHSFIFVLTNMVHIHNFLDQYPKCVWYIRPVIEYSVLP